MNTEEMYEKSENIQPGEVDAFISEVMGQDLDYNTVVEAVAASALAAARAANRSLNGGITGFQAGYVMWRFIQKWMAYDNVPMRLINYSDLLYPQYEHKYEKTITPDTWKWLQEEAAKKLAEAPEWTHPNVNAHFQSIIDGTVPFGYTVSEGW